jgi:hypothetical protein
MSALAGQPAEALLVRGRQTRQGELVVAAWAVRMRTANPAGGQRQELDPSAGRVGAAFDKSTFLEAVGQEGYVRGIALEAGCQITHGNGLADCPSCERTSAEGLHQLQLGHLPEPRQLDKP